MLFEVLDFAFVLFGFLQRVKGSEVAPFAGGGVLLARIKAELTGFEFANHVWRDAERRGAGCR